MSGYISIHRKLREHWIYKENRVFSKFEAWVDILYEVNHKDNKFLFDGVLIEVKRGSTITSLRKLSEKWKWSVTKVNSYLKLLENDKMIVVKKDTKKTVLTVVNYDLYQSEKWKKEQQSNTEKTVKKQLKNTEVTQKETNNNELIMNNNELIMNNKKNIYAVAYEYYISADLIKHNKFTQDMKKAIDKSIKELNLDLDYIKRIIDRHKEKCEKTKNDKYPVKKRSLTELFGQKKHNSVSLICSDYLDEYYIKNPNKKNLEEMTFVDKIEIANKILDGDF